MTKIFDFKMTGTALKKNLRRAGTALVAERWSAAARNRGRPGLFSTRKCLSPRAGRWTLSPSKSLRKICTPDFSDFPEFSAKLEAEHKLFRNDFSAFLVDSRNALAHVARNLVGNRAGFFRHFFKRSVLAENLDLASDINVRA